ncbi:Trm112 family protein [Streptomyces sp. NPDC004647]|uniref:Trm112 family protein n=1 Tax=Streptomyces sp. NPDC004647 TaxID=3154671 RepID=UPI0033AED364
MPLEAGLLEILACPACHAPLREVSAAGTGADADTDVDAEDGTAELACTGGGCGLAYPIRDGIPVLLVDEARRPA